MCNQGIVIFQHTSPGLNGVVIRVHGKTGETQQIPPRPVIITSSNLWYHVMRRALHLCDTLPQNQHWQSSHEENTRNQIEGHSAKYLASTPQNWQGLGKLGKTKKFTDEKSKETWRLNATWCPQLDPVADKGRCGKLVRSRWGLEIRYYNKLAYWF